MLYPYTKPSSMFFRMFFCLLTLLFSLELAGQDSTATLEKTATHSDSLPSFFSRFYQEDGSALKMTLCTDTRRLVEGKEAESYQPATLLIHVHDSLIRSYDLKIKARGNMRKEVCHFPPVRLNFDKTDLLEIGLDSTFDKIKMVLQCDMITPNEQYIWKEYLAYKMYNLITPHSFRVQLLNLTLKDPEEEGNSYEMASFLIEPEDELAARLYGEVLEREKCYTQWLDRESFLQMSVFEYMIGNTDWSVPNVHNMILLRVPEYDSMVPVPYDFDYSGLVNTHYAMPHKQFPISRVTQRLYTGLEAEAEEAKQIRKHLLEKKDSLIGMCEQFDRLSQGHHRRMIKFLEKFFDEIEATQNVQTVFTKNF